MFGERLKTIRQESGLLQKDLADILKVAPSTIGMYERGHRDPDTNTIVFLSKYFNVSSDWLLGISDIRDTCYKNKDKKPFQYEVLDESDLSADDVDKVYEYIELLKNKDKLI